VHDRLAAAQQVAHMGSWEWNIIDDTVWWSREMYEILGEDPRLQPSFTGVVDRVHPEDRQKFREQMGRTLQDGQPYRETIRVVRPDGTECVIFASARVERTPDGQPAKMIGTALDLTRFGPAEGVTAARASRAR
jgi:hypothetical protein